MSIWRSIDCPRCKGQSFDVADNGLDYEVRIGCDKCGYEMILPLDTKAIERRLSEAGKQAGEKE